MPHLSRVLFCAHAVALAAFSLACEAPSWTAKLPEDQDASPVQAVRDAGCKEPACARDAATPTKPVPDAGAADARVPAAPGADAGTVDLGDAGRVGTGDAGSDVVPDAGASGPDAGTLPGPVPVARPQRPWPVNQGSPQLADVDGDHKPDLVGFAADGAYVALANEAGFAAPMRWSTSFGSAVASGGWDAARHPRLVGDVDGDGRADLVGVAEESVVVALSTGQAFATQNVWSVDFVYATGWRVEQHPRYVVELDGDGKLDLVGFGDDGVWVAPSTGRSFGPTERWLESFGYNDDVGGWRLERHTRFVGDVDGDQRADVVGIAEADIQVSFSTGTSFAQPKTLGPTPLSIGRGWDPASEPIEAGDVDGNGMVDLIGFGRAGVQVALSMRTAFTTPTLWLSDFGASTGWSTRAHRRALADLDADGSADVVGMDDSGTHVATSTGRTFGAAQLYTPAL